MSRHPGWGPGGVAGAFEAAGLRRAADADPNYYEENSVDLSWRAKLPTYYAYQRPGSARVRIVKEFGPPVGPEEVGKIAEQPGRQFTCAPEEIEAVLRDWLGVSGGSAVRVTRESDGTYSIHPLTVAP